MSSQELPKEERPKWLVDGLIVAAISAYVYLLAFAFEYGYLSFFHVPYYLVSLTIVHVFAAAFFVIVVSMFLLPFLIWVVDVLSVSHAIVQKFILAFVITLFAEAGVFLEGRIEQEGLGVLVVFPITLGFALTLDFIKWLRTRLPSRKEGNLRTDEKKIRNPLVKSINQLMDQPHFQTVLLVALLGLGLFGTVGRGVAVTQHTFDKITQPVKAVVLRIYGDTVIALPLSDDERTIIPGLIVFKVPSQPPLLMQTMQIVGSFRPGG